MNTERLAGLLGEATPGPWRWEINVKSRIVEICGGPPKGGYGKYDLTVMSFARWGMNSAAPKFWKWNREGGWIGKPGRADEFAVPVEGREHHAAWFQAIDHPDATLMVEAVNALPTLLSRLAALEEALTDFCLSAECAAGVDEGASHDAASSEIMSAMGSAMAASYDRARATLAQAVAGEGQ